ncbi:uncharacterized protein LOC144160952 [Haemaphysalis longicornis]
MISAMPAVAVRRERRRSKTGRGLSSRQGSVTSLPHRPDSISTLNSLPTVGKGAARRWRHRGGTAQEQRARLLIYLATVLLVTGLVLLFLGVGAGVTHTRAIGLLFIAFGAVLCLIKVFITPEHNHTIVRRARLVSSRESLYAAPAVKTVPEETLDQVRREVQERTTDGAIADPSQPPTQSHTQPNSDGGSNHSLNVPETQGLISDHVAPLADGRF